MSRFLPAGRRHLAEPTRPPAEACDEALTVDSEHTATVQEIRLVAVHLPSAAVDVRLEALGLREGTVS